MKDGQVVVVFPSQLSVNKTKSLLSNLKKIIKIRNQKFKTILEDGPVIVIHTDEPIVILSTINSLFGIEKIAIAKKIDNNFKRVVSTITKIGSNLILRGEKFYVQVEGHSSTYLPKDIQLAATTSLIEKISHLKAKPGTKENFDKLLYTFLTKSSAYVSIFMDKGYGGNPYNFHQKKIICSVYDEFSAICCLQTIKMGFDVKILVCYHNEDQLLRTVKILNHILPTIVRKQVQLEFFKLPIKDEGVDSHIVFVNVITAILSSIARSNKIKRVSLAISPLIYPLWFVEDSLSNISQKGLIPWLPLPMMDKDLIDAAKEIGLEKFLPKIKEIYKTNFKKKRISRNQTLNLCQAAIKTRKKIMVTVGTKNIHDILDSLNH